MGFWPWGKGCSGREGNGFSPFRAFADKRIPASDRDVARLVEFEAMTSGFANLPINQAGEELEAAFLCSFYNKFALLDDLLAGNDSKRITCSIYDSEMYSLDQRKFLRPIEKIREALVVNQDKLLGAYLFGSYASYDFIPGWSDADILLILSPKCFESPRTLLEVRDLLLHLQAYLVQIDPLQLHGFFVLTWADLIWYPQVYFPCALFERSLALLDYDEPLEVWERDDEVERVEIFDAQVAYFTKLRLSGRLPQTHVERKLFFHKAFTLPLYFLQATGMHCYKKESFAIACQKYPQLDWDCLSLPTAWMRERPNEMGFERMVSRLPGMDPYRRACLLWSKAYRWAHGLRRPFWQVSPGEFQKVVEDITNLAVSCHEQLHA